jgi:hypothetical protein
MDVTIEDDKAVQAIKQVLMDSFPPIWGVDDDEDDPGITEAEAEGVAEKVIAILAEYE